MIIKWKKTPVGKVAEGTFPSGEHWTALVYKNAFGGWDAEWTLAYKYDGGMSHLPRERDAKAMVLGFLFAFG